MKILFIAGFSIFISWKQVNSQSLFNQAVDSNLAVNVSGLMVVSNDKKLFVTSSGDDVNPLMLKSDLDGNVLWQEQQKRTNHNKSVSLGEMVEVDTTYFMAGSDEYKKSALLMHFSRNGDLMDFKVYQPAGMSSVKGPLITRTDDDHLIMAGPARDNGKQDMILWLRTTIHGDLQIFQTLKAKKDLYPVKLLPLTNGNGEVIVATYAGDYYPSQYVNNFPRLFRMDSAGSCVWAKDFYLPYGVTLSDIIQLSDGGYLMIGNGIYKSYVFKTNADFEPQWMKSVEFPNPFGAGPFPAFYAVLEKENHHLMISGSQQFNTTDAYSLLVETDEAGNLLQARLDSMGNAITKMAAMPNQFILLAGRDRLNHLSFASLDSNSNHACSLSPVLLNWYDDVMPVVIKKAFNPGVQTNDPSPDTFKFPRLDPPFHIYNGCTGITSVSEIENVPDKLLLYPNPVQNELSIVRPSFSEGGSSAETIHIYDLQGRIQHCGFRILNSGLNSAITLNTENLTDGFYTLQIINNKTGEAATGNFVKQQ